VSAAAALDAGLVAPDELALALRRRCRSLEGRVRHGRRSGWDINVLAQLREELSPLVHGLHALGLGAAVDTALKLAEALAAPLEAQTLPDPVASAKLASLIAALLEQLPESSGAEVVQTWTLLPHPPRAEALPIGFWRRFVTDAGPATRVPVAERKRSLASGRDVDGRVDRSTLASVEMGKGMLTKVETLRLYLLSDESPEALALAEALRHSGFEVDALTTIDELVELSGALPADVVLIDGMHAHAIAAIGGAMKPIRARSSQPIRMAVISDTDDVMARLSARRAGADAVLVRPHGGADVAHRLRELFNVTESSFRVMIVEDDRAQALFAEGVLRNAGMETRIVLDPLDVLPALEGFAPDLILMDFHMPVANGIELTALIREREDFAHTPIVFLTGEQDQDVRFDALDAGGDDFLSKPIRPKHLIASVQGRVRRFRDVQQIRKREPAAAPSAPLDSGIIERGRMMARIDQMITGGSHRGGVVFLEMETIARLREALGLSQFERLHVDALALLASEAGERLLCRFADGGFLVLDTEHDAEGLLKLGATLRDALARHEFKLGDQSVLTPAVAGIAPFSPELTDAGGMLNAVEKVAHTARGVDGRVEAYRPLGAEEAERQAALIDDMRLAMAESRLSLLYQPIVAVAGGEQSRYQTLLRLDTASGTRMTASEVVPAAERSGFIVEIDRWVMREAIGRLASARATGTGMTLFITQSPYTLAHGGHAEWLRSELRALDVPGSALVIELRLADAVVHTGTLREFCSAMVADGLRFCLSQFEPGVEVDSLIEQLPLSLVKLAGKYSTGALSSSVRDELKVIIDRAHRRSLEVIGHSVEDPQAAATLWMSGVDFVQGNLVQRAGEVLDFDFNQAIL